MLPNVPVEHLWHTRKWEARHQYAAMAGETMIGPRARRRRIDEMTDLKPLATDPTKGLLPATNEEPMPPAETAFEKFDAPIPVMKPMLPKAEAILKYIELIDETRIYTNFGPLSEELAKRFSLLFSVPERAVTLTGSGTAALMAAIFSVCGSPREDRTLAICPAFTFPATAIAAERCGYQPYIADVKRDDWMLDLDGLLSHPRLHEVAVVIAVAPFGRPVAQAQLREFRDRTSIPVIVDAAACFAALEDSPANLIADIPVALSLHATKSFGIGEGGALIWNSREAGTNPRRAINFGFRNTRNSVGESFNGKMSEYSAAVGLAALDEWPTKRFELQARTNVYLEAFRAAGLEHRFIGYPVVDLSYPLFLAPSRRSAETVCRALRAADVGFRMWYGGGLHRHKHFEDTIRDPLPNTEYLTRRLIGLPTAPDLDSRIAERIALIIAEAAGKSALEKP